MINKVNGINNFAIVGWSCRFPEGVKDPEEFWNFLATHRTAVSNYPTSRLSWSGLSNPHLFQNYLGFFLDDDEVLGFDGSFFGISKRELNAMDPQHRLLLTLSWEAWENAQINVQQLRKRPVGIFIGLSTDDYSKVGVDEKEFSHLNAYKMWGTGRSLAAGRLAYFYDFRGPVVQVDTSCSSAMTAVSLACQSLALGESEVALVGSMNLILSPENYVGLSNMNALSADGLCRSYDELAGGYGRGEGGGCLIIKTLSAAQRDRDFVLAVIRGIALNHDGRSNGLTAPNVEAQEEVIRRAQNCAGLAPEDIAFIEGHGTGTKLGDPIEIEALQAVFSDVSHPIFVSSAKAHVGHLEAAAGLAGIFKAVLNIRHRKISSQNFLDEPNRLINWSKISLKPVTSDVGLSSLSGPIRGGVSSFGMSGTNGHIILEEAHRESQISVKENRGPWGLLLSAKSERALDLLIERYTSIVSPDLSEQALCSAAFFGRAAFPHRAFIIFNDRNDLLQKLERKTVEYSVVSGAKLRSLHIVLGERLCDYREALLQLKQSSQFASDALNSLSWFSTKMTTFDSLGSISEAAISTSQILHNYVHLKALMNFVNYEELNITCGEFGYRALALAFGLIDGELLESPVDAERIKTTAQQNKIRIIDTPDESSSEIVTVFLDSDDRRPLDSHRKIYLSSKNPIDQTWVQLFGQLFLSGLDLKGIPWCDRQLRTAVTLPKSVLEPSKYWVEDIPASKGLFSDSKKVEAPTGDFNFSVMFGKRERLAFNDHRIGKEVVLPASGIILFVLKALKSFFPNQLFVIEVLDLIKQVKLHGDGDEPERFWVAFNPVENDPLQFNFQIKFERIGSSELVAKGNVKGRLKPHDHKFNSVPIVEMAERKMISATEFYKQFKTRGLDYGTSYRLLDQVNTGKEPSGELSVGVDGDFTPAILDGVFQVLGGYFWDNELEIPEESLLLPVKIVGLWLANIRPTRIKIQHKDIKKDKGFLTSQITIRDAMSGSLVGSIEEFVVRRIELASISSASSKTNDNQEITGASPGKANTSTKSSSSNDVEQLLRRTIARALGDQDPSNLDGNRNLFEFGLDSLMVVEIEDDFKTQFGVEIEPSAFFQHDTISKLSNYVASLINKAPGGSLKSSKTTPSILGGDKAISSLAISQWRKHFEKNVEAHTSLFCLPYAGGNATFYSPWKGTLKNIEVCPIQLPGHSERFDELPLKTIGEMARYTVECIDRWLKEKRAIALFGHSLGGLIAFEAAHLLQKANYPLKHLFISGQRAPRLPLRSDPLHKRDDDSFIREIARIEGIPDAILQSKERMQLFVPLLKNDFRAGENYTCNQNAPLDCPICVFHARSDEVAPECEIYEWSKETDKVFSAIKFPGKHFFIKDFMREIGERVQFSIEKSLSA